MRGLVNRSRMLNGHQQKEVCFVVATTEGQFPAVPQKRAGACAAQLPVCQKYRPDLEWRVFEIVQDHVTANGITTIEPAKVKGLSDELNKKLLGAIRHRYEQWSDLL